MLGICVFELDPAQHANKLPAFVSIYTHQHLPIWPFIVLIHNFLYLYFQGDALSEMPHFGNGKKPQCGNV